MEPLAHSASERHPEPQTYAEHIQKVANAARVFAEEVSLFIADGAKRRRFINSVTAAAIYHDLGKLWEENQKVLRSNADEKLPINHVDAGTYHLIQQGDILSALLVYSHHRGLPSLHEEAAKNRLCLRDPELADRTVQELETYLTTHQRYVSLQTASPDRRPADESSMWDRMALSCLVDADHSDTAHHYGGEECAKPVPERWASRLTRLDEYVASLGRTARIGERTQIRTAIYEACRKAPPDPAIRSCDSPVGTGKTTAVMAHLLRAADQKHLRRIFVVLPFINIINQAVEVYRRSLVDSGEIPDAVVAAHHHRAEFPSRSFRHLTMRWDARVVVTTSVQFFETLAACRPSSLRKLHHVAGSAIFIDEAHAALPAHLWRLAWMWLQELARVWGCHVVLGSGSLQRFWTLEEFADTSISIPELVPDTLRKDASQFESGRIRYRTKPKPLDKTELAEFVLGQPGPRVVVLNTVQSAAMMADEFSRRIGRRLVEHLSTALCPRDRAPVVKRVAARLRERSDANWVLVSTSCVESGLDLSFRTAIRESCGLVNLVQIGGRVNRHAEDAISDVWSVQILDPSLPNHPMFEVSGRILSELFEEGKVGPEWATEAMRREIRQDPDQRADKLVEREQNLDFPEVACLFRVIQSPTVTVVVDPNLAERIERRFPVKWSELQDASVQIWSNKIKGWPLRPIHRQEELFVWTGGYDDFIGYMAGVLPLLRPNDIVI